MKNEIDLLLENKSLKTEFLVKQLDLDDIWAEPKDPLQANLELKFLLECLEIAKTGKNGDDLFELGHFPPPVKDPTVPSEDWEIFLNWVNRKPVLQFLKDVLVLKDPDSIPEGEIEYELNQLVDGIRKHGTNIDLAEGPPIILYKLLHEWIFNENPIVRYSSGWWMDGCGHYCPGCFLRPWCDMGTEFIWSEDDEINNIYYRPELAKYVSAWQPIFASLKEECEERERKFDEWVKARDHARMNK